MIATEQLNGVSGVYCAIHRNSGSTYVGSSVDIGARRASHRAAAMNRSSPNHFHKCLRNHGPDEFDFEVLERCSATDLKSREDFWMSFLGSAKGEGMNTFKSSSWHPMSPMAEATKHRISIAMRGKKKSQPHGISRKPTQEKVRISNVGRKLTEEHKQKISKSCKGVERTLETRARMKLAKKGWKISPETGLKISLANKGRKVSEHTRKLMKTAQSSRWALYRANKQSNLLVSTKPVAVETAKDRRAKNNKQKAKQNENSV